MRVLFVEDNEVSLKVAKTFLDLEFPEVDYAQNGSKALDLWKEHHHSIIVTDLYMPEASGFDLIEEVRKRSMYNEYVYIIVLTADDKDSTMAKVFSSSADDYITKPLSFVEIINRIKVGIRLITEVQKKTVLSTLNTISISGDYEFRNTAKYIRTISEYIGLKLIESGNFDSEFSKEDLYKVSDASMFYNMEVFSKNIEYVYNVLNQFERESKEVNGVFSVAKEMLLAQDENFDGSGSPVGISGVQIPAASRLISPVKYYISLISNGIDGRRLSHDQAISELIYESGKQFDPTVVTMIKNNGLVLKQITHALHSK